MRVLVVGGTSSVARYLKAVLQDTFEVLTAGRTNCDIYLDLNDVNAEITLPAGLDIVVNTAAHFGGACDEDIEGAMRVNVLGSLKLAQASVKAGVRHFVSISSIYADLTSASPQYSVYSLSKKHSDELLTYYCQLHSMPLAIIRPSQIYGSEDGFAKHQPFFYMMLDNARKGNDIVLYGSHDPRRNYIHIEDVAAIVAKVVRERVDGNFTCSYPEDVTYSQIANAAIQAFGSTSQVRFLHDKPSIPDNVFAKDDSLYKRISFYPRISIIEGVKKIADYKR